MENFKTKEQKVSIIIPFVSLSSYVLECIEHCLRLNYSEFEIVLLPDIDIELPLKFINRRIRILKTGPEAIPKKRNMGLNISNSDFYAFIDSDAYPEENWLKNAVLCFSKSKNIWAVGGPNITPPNDGISKKCVGNSLKSFLVSGANSFRKKIAANRFCNDLPTCNLIVRKETIESLVGFNEKLITGEDIEFCKRIVSKRKKIYYNNKVIVYHHNRSLFKPFFYQRIIYGMSVFKLIREKFCLHTILLFTPLFFIIFLILGFVIGIFYQPVFYIWLSVALIYAVVLLAEAIRYSAKILEMPLTFIALAVGNLTPGIGSLLKIFQVNVDVKKIYKNYECAKQSSIYPVS